MTKRDEIGLELAADIINGLKKDLELAREAAKRTFCPACAGMTRKQIAADTDQSLALVIADLTLRAEVAEAEQRSLRAHLTYSESRRCRHEVSERGDDALKGQVSGLLSQVKAMAVDKKVLVDMLSGLYRRAQDPELYQPSSDGGNASQMALSDALGNVKAFLKQQGAL